MVWFDGFKDMVLPLFYVLVELSGGLFGVVLTWLYSFPGISLRFSSSFPIDGVHIFWGVGGIDVMKEDNLMIYLMLCNRLQE